MNLMELSKVIEEFNIIVGQLYSDFNGVYLFGSQVKGTANTDSDVDLVVLFDSLSYEKDLELAGIAGEIEYKHDIFIDLQSYTLDELKRNSVFYNEVVNKGLFYEPAR